MEQRRAPLLVTIPPPIIYAATFAVGMAVDWLMPWSPDWTGSDLVQWLGWAFIIAGLLLGPGSASLFALRRTTLNPAGQPARLVTNGPFAVSRNPMYAGVTMIYLGAALALGKLWPLVLVVLPWATTNWIVIPFEEARLRNTFGQAYVDYCRRVRRWV
ncbi:MAG TPA: isoprenylcysteine carboxylmethyltransferase family protein [Stellaceae bacterium]|nr:isoprenylcysteine carboxylmethyltransferase family protein [Stellaceae bacterium]